MPRIHRVSPAGTFQHVIARFVNSEFRLRGPDERAAYLRRLNDALVRSDWALLGYALMSSHVHLALVAGDAPLSAWAKPLHTGVAADLNRRHARLGPVFAARPRNHAVPASDVARLLAYLHNNPVRAGVAARALDSDWTSHQAFVRGASDLACLDIAAALARCGFDKSADGRAAFAALVDARAGEPREVRWSDEHAATSRNHVRLEIGAMAEIGSSTISSSGVARDVFASAEATLHARWPGSLRTLLSLVARATNLSVDEITSRRGPLFRVQARRLFVLTGTLLGRGVGELGATVGVGMSAAVHLIRRDRNRVEALEPIARALAEECSGWPTAHGSIGEPPLGVAREVML